MSLDNLNSSELAAMVRNLEHDKDSLLEMIYERNSIINDLKIKESSLRNYVQELEGKLKYGA